MINLKITGIGKSAGMGEDVRIETGQLTDAGQVKLRPDLAFYPLDDGLVIFSETAQSLVGLNATAALIATRLKEGEPATSLAAGLAASGPCTQQEAAGWVTATLDALRSQGLLAGTEIKHNDIPDESRSRRLAIQRSKIPPLVPFQPKVTGHYQLLGTRALIRYSHVSQKRMVDAVIGHLAGGQDAAPNLIIDVLGEPWGEMQLSSNVYCDGKPEGRAIQLSRLGPLVKTAVWLSAVNAHDFLLDLHAGVVAKGDRCILLPAAAGSGKSSLTAALTHAGYAYLSDEVALIERDSFQVPAVPLAVCVKSTGWDLMSRYHPQIGGLPTHRRDDGKVVRYVQPPLESLRNSPALVSHIFFPRYSASEQTRCVPMNRSDALARLMEQCIALRQRLDESNVRELLRWIGSIDCYALTFSSLDEAVRLISDTVGS